MYYIAFALLWLVSLIPFWFIYLISDFIYAIIYYIVKYRRDIVESNLKIAFPEKTDTERTVIARGFYKNLIDTFLESVKFITISKKTLQKRSTAELDVLNRLIIQGKNIHIMAGHQFNWEYANLLYASQLPVPFVGVYMPLSNKILDKIFFNFRKRYGTVLIPATTFKTKMHSVFAKQYLLALAADQNPGNPANGYWMHFFGKPVPFVTGPSKGAIKNNTAVVMVGFKKIKRGFYHFETKLITEDGTKYTPEELTILYKNALEKVIKGDPANYLWSHRRWKYQWKEEYGKILD